MPAFFRKTSANKYWKPCTYCTKHSRIDTVIARAHLCGCRIPAPFSRRTSSDLPLPFCLLSPSHPGSGPGLGDPKWALARASLADQQTSRPQGPPNTLPPRPCKARSRSTLTPKQDSMPGDMKRFPEAQAHLVLARWHRAKSGTRKPRPVGPAWSVRVMTTGKSMMHLA